MKALALIVNGELNFNGQVDLTRFMVPLKYMSSSLTKDEIWFLAQSCKLGTIEEEDDEVTGEKVKTRYVTFQPFLRALRRSMPEVNDMFAERSKFLAEAHAKDVFEDDLSDLTESIDPEEERLRLEELDQQKQ